MLSRDQVKHIAKLARLSLTKAEVEKFQKELSLILDYVEKLKEVNVEGVEPTFYALEMKNIWREDESKRQEIEKVKDLIKAFPERKETFLKVKKIL